MTRTTLNNAKDAKKKVFVVLTENLLTGIDEEAQRLTLSRSQIVRLACQAFLRQRVKEAN